MSKIVILSVFFIVSVFSCTSKNEGIIMTVNGPIDAGKAGIALIHEHILVDFIGADSINENRWDKDEVAEIALPYLKQIKEMGCVTFVECTPDFLGRDPLLMKQLSASSGLNIITNTGYYGAVNDKYMPQFAFSESADQISTRWIKEWEEGIDGTGIKPGFIKIGVESDSLSEHHIKIVTAAARAHLKTGLTIASHTGPSLPAFEEIEVLRDEGVSPEAFIWVHAQSEKDLAAHVSAAKMGAWISLDGISGDNIAEYAEMLKNLKENQLLGKVLISHDAGWYRPGEPGGGEFRGYTDIFEKFIPLLKTENFTDKEIETLLVKNPAEAFTVRVRRMN